MKYFTPDLYLQFNSKNGTFAAKANDEWDAAIQKYHKHLRKICASLAPNVRNLAKSLCLHDARYLGLSHPRIPHLAHPIAVLAARKDATDFLLVYTLAKQPDVQEIKLTWPFSKRQVHWLYDEFDVDSRGNQPFLSGGEHGRPAGLV